MLREGLGFKSVLKVCPVLDLGVIPIEHTISAACLPRCIFKNPSRFMLFVDLTNVGYKT